MHTYIVGKSEGHTVIDAVGAATRLPATGLAAGGPVASSGYSQGGGGFGFQLLAALRPGQADAGRCRLIVNWG